MNNLLSKGLQIYVRQDVSYSWKCLHLYSTCKCGVCGWPPRPNLGACIPKGAVCGSYYITLKVSGVWYLLLSRHMHTSYVFLQSSTGTSFFLYTLAKLSLAVCHKIQKFRLLAAHWLFSLVGYCHDRVQLRFTFRRFRAISLVSTCASVWMSSALSSLYLPSLYFWRSGKQPVLGNQTDAIKQAYPPI